MQLPCILSLSNVVCIFFVVAAVECDTKAALSYVRSLFHVELFENCLPPIILHHQLYNIVHSRTVVDKELVRKCRFFILLVFVSFIVLGLQWGFFMCAYALYYAYRS